MSALTPQVAPKQDAGGFRIRLQVAMMLVVSATTALVLFIAQRNTDQTYQQHLQEEFAGRFVDLLRVQDTRQNLVMEQCRRLAKNVRIRAALEEGDVEDLYENATVELRDVIKPKDGVNLSPKTRANRANFLRFLNADGKVLSEKASANGESLEAWEKKLSAAAPAGDEQQIGYVMAPDDQGEPTPNEVIATPVIASDTGARLGTLVLGYASVNLGLTSGIYFDGDLYMPALTSAARTSLTHDLEATLSARPVVKNKAIVHLDNEQQWLFYKILNPGSHFPPAYQVCLYPLGGAMAQQQRLQWQIIGGGLLILIAGLGVIRVISTRLAKPVEQLAVDSADHLAKREEAEAALELTEQKYRSIFENAVEGIFLLSLEGCFLSANPALARIFGCESEKELLGENIFRRFQVDSVSAEQFLERVRKDGVVSNFECEVLRKDGKRIWVSQNARAIPGMDGTLHHLEGTLEDVTERKRAADTLVELNTELEKALSDLRTTQQQVIQQERLRALGEMASGIAHDFNNALMPIVGFSELLLMRPEILQDPAKAGNYLDVIHTGAKDAASIVGRLREFYRSNEKSDVFAAVEVNRMIEQVVALTQPKWKDQAQSHGAEVTIRTELQATKPTCGDESALREVLTNLIFNAVDAMPGGGTLTLRSRDDGDRIIIEVADSGTGMTPEVRERCLEPFFSTKGERGTGLGLAMVFGILQRHSGAVDIESEVGKGTTFVVRLPVQEPGSESANPLAAVPEQKPLRVLLVDDEPQIREVLAAFLESDGHTVSLACNGLEGIRTFRDNDIEVVITDKAMPGMSGDQMAVAIKKFAPRTPIVLLTGFSQFLEGDVIPGIDVLATKPISMPNLRAAIYKAVNAA